MNEVRVTVRGDGTVEFIYNDALCGLLDLGESETHRASEVEPFDGSGGESFASQHKNGWTADMRLSDGPVLGPFKTRQAALDAEVAWLRENRGL